MSILLKSIRVATLAACAALAACASTQPVPYSGIASSNQMQASAHDETGRIPYEYKSGADLRTYSMFTVDPVVVYAGADNQFEDVSERDKIELAKYMQATFSAKLAALAKNNADPHAQALRIKLTLTGAKESTPVLSCEMSGVWPGRIPNSPPSPGTVTISTGSASTRRSGVTTSS